METTLVGLVGQCTGSATRDCSLLGTLFAELDIGVADANTVDA